MIETFLDKAFSFELYLHMIMKKIDFLGKGAVGNDIIQKYQLTVCRANDIIKNYSATKKQKRTLSKKKFGGKILIIGEGWCGDCSQIIPVIVKLFKGRNPVKIINREGNNDLMKLFLTNGNEAIPIVIFLDENNNVITHWGPRTKFGSELLLKFKLNPENYPKNLFLTDLQNYYTNNKGVDIIDEIISIL